MASRTLTVNLIGDAKSAIDAMNKTEKSAGGMGAKLQKAGKVAAVGIAAVGTAAVAAGVVALKFAGDFDNAYDTIRTGTGATGKALEGLEADFRSVVKEVPTDFATASTAIADLNTRLGTTGETLQDSAKQFLNLSRVTGTDVSANIAKATRVFGDWDVAAQDQEATLDALFRATQVSGIGFDQLANSVVQFGAPLRSMGFSLEESTAMLAKWEKEGVNTERILGSLSLAANHFASEGVDMKEGLEATIVAIENAGSSSEALAIAQGVVGSRAANDFQAAIREGRFELDDYMEAISNGEDTINAVAADTDDWREKLTLLKNQGLVAMEPALMAVFDGLTRFVDLISTQVVPWIQEHLVPAFREHVLPVLEAVAGFITGTLSAAFDTFVSVILPRIQEFATGVGEQFQKFQGYYETDIKPALDNIRTAVETVVGAVVGFIAEHWPRIQQIIQPVLEQVQNIVETVWGTIREVFEIFIDLLGGDFSSAWENFKQLIGIVWDGIKETIENAIQIVKNVLSAAWDAIKATADAGWELIKKGMAAAWDFLKEKASELASWIGDKIDDIIQWFKDLPGRIWDAVSDIGSWLVEQGGELIDGLWTGIKDIWESVTGWFGDLPLKAARALKSLIDPAVVLLQVGKDIITGLWDGMKAIWPMITGWLGDQAAKLPDWIKDPLGIASPSKVFAGIGENLMEGLSLGLGEGFERFTSPVLQEIEGTISKFLRDPLGAGGMHGGNLVAKLEGQIALGENVLGNEGIGGELKRFWTRTVNEATSALDTIKGTLDERRTIEQSFLDEQIAAYLDGGKQAVDVVKATQEAMRADVMRIAGQLVDTFGIAVPAALSTAMAHVRDAAASTSTAAAAVAQQAAALQESITGVVSNIANVARGGTGGLNGQAISNVMASLIDKEGFSLDRATDLINQSSRDPDRIGDLNKYLRQFGGSFANGGVVPGRIGEPRMILAHGGETVMPTHRGGMGTVINNYFEINTLDGRDAEDHIVEALRRAQSRGRIRGGVLA